MGEPVLRLVVPADPDDRDVAGWPASPDSGPARPATSPPAGSGSGPGPGATTPATSGTAKGATFSAAPPWWPGEPGPPEPGSDGETTAENGEPEPAGLEPYGRQMTWGERAWRLIAHWWALHREDAGRPGGFWHGVAHGRPDSLAQVHGYAVSRAWVPEGHEGALIPCIGAAYSHTIAKGGTALGLFIAWVTQRMLRFALFLLVTGTVAGLIIWFG